MIARVQAAVAIAGTLLFIIGGRAHAYQNVGRFAVSPEEGGGGGRFFTGAPGDGYTCGVCHVAETSPHLAIDGLPIDGYVPGESYVVTIDWDDALPLVALNLTITDAAGKPFGTVAGLSPDQLTDADLCATTKTPDVVAASTADRNLVYVAACGGRQAAFQWTAPSSAAPPPRNGATDALFRGSLVASNADNAVTGDAVTDLSRVIGVKGPANPVAMKASAQCAALRRNTGAAAGAGHALVAIAALLLARRSGRRRA
jgi:hypothetical protein